MIGRFVFGVPPLLPPVCLSILRLPPLLPPIGRVDLNWAVEGEGKVVVGREGQKGCAVFWWGRLCSVRLGWRRIGVGSSAVEAVGVSLDRGSGRGVNGWP